ncbi:hypothetical protein FALBO_16837 [Fusarium albosuccineum]|uniref:Nucleoside phosphorylase domain-containing protein n=1 Tax=Fusarium albosuccineum TaxID=1237068 RepID=A0A8H4KE97_9HYPO|nr:hypothetical protein FALBO_16837 [Fusarium albosuccineum]
MSLPTNLKQLDFLIGWVCVLEKEFGAAMDVLDETYGTNFDAGFISGDGDRNEYHLGRVAGHNVVINCPQSGTSGQLKAFEIATSMKSTFSAIRFVLLVGIGGGAPSEQADIRLGDVVLGTAVVPYQKGKFTDVGFEVTGHKLEPPQELLTAVTSFRYRLRRGPTLEQMIEKALCQGEGLQATYSRPADDRLLLSDAFHQGRMCHCLQPRLEDVSKLVSRRKRPPGGLVQTHCGIIGSADQVLKNAMERDRLVSQEKIICFEMEAAAVMRSTRSISVRGISDYSDGHKNDAWHDYAAFAAAVCAKELLKSLSPMLVAQSALELTREELRRLVEGVVSRVETNVSQSFRRHEEEIMAVKDSNNLVDSNIKFLTKYTKQLEASDTKMKDMLTDLVVFQKKLEGSIRSLQAQVELQVANADFVTRKEWEELKQQVDKTAEEVDKLGAAQEVLATAAGLADLIGRDIGNSRLGWVSKYLNVGSTVAGQVKKLKPFYSRKSGEETSSATESRGRGSFQSSRPSTPFSAESLYPESTGQSSNIDKPPPQPPRPTEMSPSPSQKPLIRSTKRIAPLQPPTETVMPTGPSNSSRECWSNCRTSEKPKPPNIPVKPGHLSAGNSRSKVQGIVSKFEDRS